MSYAKSFEKIFAECGMGGATMPGYKVNNARTALVSTDYEYNDDMSACPKGVKCLLLGAGGTATISEYHGDDFWVGWFPLPRKKIKPRLLQMSKPVLAPQ